MEEEEVEEDLLEVDLGRNVEVRKVCIEWLNELDAVTTHPNATTDRLRPLIFMA